MEKVLFYYLFTMYKNSKRRKIYYLRFERGDEGKKKS